MYPKGWLIGHCSFYSGKTNTKIGKKNLVGKVG
jgi:hypothetical protein